MSVSIQNIYGYSQSSLTMITSCSELVNFNCVTTGVVLVLSEQLLCNSRVALMRTIMPHVRLGQGP